MIRTIYLPLPLRVGPCVHIRQPVQLHVSSLQKHDDSIRVSVDTEAMVSCIMAMCLRPPAKLHEACIAAMQSSHVVGVPVCPGQECAESKVLGIRLGSLLHEPLLQ